MKSTKELTIKLIGEILAFANKETTTKLEIRNKLADLLILLASI